jgi:hypothetical protein
LSLLPILVAMQQRFLVLQTSVEIARVKFPDRGGVKNKRFGFKLLDGDGEKPGVATIFP